jgi:hypothetical protein
VIDSPSTTDLLNIQRLLFDYAWACDSGDWELLRSVFTDDARLDYSSTGGPAAGRDEVVAWLQESLSLLGFIQHVVSNFRIEISGDQAEGRAMFLTSFRLPGSDDVVLTGGYYDLELVRTSNGWRMRSFVEENQWMSSGIGTKSHG